MSSAPQSSIPAGATTYKSDREPYIKYDDTTGLLLFGMGTGFAVDGDGKFVVPPDERTYDARDPDSTTMLPALIEAVNSLKASEWEGVKSNQAKWHSPLSDMMKRSYNHEKTPSLSNSWQTGQSNPKNNRASNITLECAPSDVPRQPDERLHYIQLSQVLPDARIRFRDPKDNSLGFDVEVTVDGTVRERGVETVVPLRMYFFDSVANTVASILSHHLTAQLNSLKELKRNDPQITGVANSVAAVTRAVLNRSTEWDLHPYDIDGTGPSDADSTEMTERMQIENTAYTQAPTVAFVVKRGE